MKAKVALTRDARAERNLGQAELAICPQELLRSSAAAFNLPGPVI